MMKENNFAVFILSHGRPDRVLTYKSLLKSKYTGKIYIVIDDEDETEADYMGRFPNMVIKFSKEEIEKTFDRADNFKDRRVIVYARNAVFKIAEDLGVKYFMQLDDDYTNFRYKFFLKGEEIAFGDKTIRNLDSVFDYMIDFYKSIPALSLAMAQGGDFIGGRLNNNMAKDIVLKRKCMNTILCSTERKFTFTGRINEDVNTYVDKGARGELFFTTNVIAINQLQTQSNKEGMTNIYLENGTYIKSFYSVMFQPSSVKIGLLINQGHSRIHHHVNWNNAVPKILNEQYRK